MAKENPNPKYFIADKETLDKCYEILSANEIYGFIEHNAVLDPATRIEYIGANKDYSPITVTMGGGYSLGDWEDFPWLKANRPYMVHSDGSPDYRLDPENYNNREDGTPSDVSNTKYDGGAFSWCQKIYQRQYMAGSDRVVQYSMVPRDGFEPIGFKTDDGTEYEGFWIPMFYGATHADSGTKLRSLSGLQPQHTTTTENQKAAIDAVGANARFFGGEATQLLVDLEIMFARTTDLQKAYGKGNCSGYNAELKPTYGVKENAVIGGGQFYGTDDGKSLNKIFHSIAMGSYQIWLRDPYMLQCNDRIKVGLGYKYDITGESYVDTGILFHDNRTWDGASNAVEYPSEYRYIPHFGNMPAGTMKGGSSTTGGCDGQWCHKPGTAEFVGCFLRFGGCRHGDVCGGRCLASDRAPAYADWGYGVALLLFPPVGQAA